MQWPAANCAADSHGHPANAHTDDHTQPDGHTKSDSHADADVHSHGYANPHPDASPDDRGDAPADLSWQ
jgi:hypothetical protein